MKLYSRGVALIAIGLLCGDAAAQVAATPLITPKVLAKKAAGKKAHGKIAQPIYTVSLYSPERDAARDLAATIRRAKKERKRILLEVGGTW